MIENLWSKCKNIFMLKNKNKYVIDGIITEAKTVKILYVMNCTNPVLL